MTQQAKRAPVNNAEPPLPQNLDAELSVLGAILQDDRAPNETLAQVVTEKLDAEDFYDVRHQRIFAAMCTMAAAHTDSLIDIVALTDFLRTEGKLEDAGGAAFVSGLDSGVTKRLNPEHVRIIKKKSRMRQIAYASHDIEQAAREGEEDPDALDRLGQLTEKPRPVTAAGIALPDMPDAVLDGRLGEICLTRMRDFPIAYAWTALLVAAGALIKRQEHGTLRANLFGALVGPVHSGKTAAIDCAHFLLDVKDPLLAQLKAGSAEGLLAKIGDQQGQGVLLYPDELAHLLEKTQITNASFAYILNSLFYKSEEELTIAHGKTVRFNCRLSLVGGIVDEKFDDSFGSATTCGLYDRFLFGQCPSSAEYLWRPIEGRPATTDTFDEVPVDREIWAARDDLVAKEKLSPRLLEIALRAAGICAAFDGRESLLAKNLEPAWELARYQDRVRMLLQPNAGRNFEAKIALKILAYLNRHAPDGQWLVLRQVLRDTRAYDYAPSVAERAIDAMKFGVAIEERQTTVGKGQKQRQIRLGGDCR